MHIPFWLSVVALSPVLAIQALHTRRSTMRLPQASDSTNGQWGTGRATTGLLVTGESTAASVGVSRHSQGLASQLALQLHERSGQTVAWHTLGVNGIRLEDLLAYLADRPLPEVDHILVSVGVNDTTGLTPRRHYRTRLTSLVERLQQAQPAISVSLLAVPPVHRFTALPVPLRQLLGWRARQLDHQHRQLAASRPGLNYLHYPALEDQALLAEDGYHPSASGYRAMAAALAEQLLQTKL